jgi:hypothetical protein
MRTPCWILVLVLGLTLVLSLESRSAAPATAEAEHIDLLIRQLGSKRFRERESATQSLDALGASALEALHKAVAHTDPEIRRRAEGLVKRIRKRIETAQLLEPKHVHLVFKDTPVTGAVNEFARQTGMAIHLNGSKARLWDRKVTLDTGETTFWQAYEQFCKTAGLTDWVGAVEPVTEQQVVRVWRGNGGAGQVRVVTVIRNGDLRQSAVHEGLSLMDGKPQEAPTYYAGAVRLRALQAGTTTAAAVPKNEPLFILEVLAEPKLSWQRLIGVHIDQAVDENGQQLVPVLTPSTDTALAGRGGGNGMVMVVDAETGQVLNDKRELLVRFQPDAKSSQTLKEVKGVVSVQVQTPVQHVLRVDQILKAAGQTIHGPDGEVLKILEVTHQQNGDVGLKLQMEDPNQLFAVYGPARVIMRRARIMAIRNARMGRVQEVNDNRDGTWSLLDGRGKGWSLISGPEIVPDGNGVTQEIRLTYRSHDGQEEAARLTYAARRTLVLEVPFVLKDVSLARQADTAQRRNGGRGYLYDAR